MDKVLIVDDDPIFLERLRDELQKYVGQFETLTAANGEEALKILENQRISVLVTGLDMPRMNGPALLEHMLRHRPQIPCVVVTEPDGPAVGDIAAPGNILGCVAKPLAADALFTLIMEGLERLDEGVFWRSQRNR